MPGETSKRIGDFGEAFYENFFKRFGWSQLGDSNVDVDCIYDKHTTSTGRDRKTHGIDTVYCYTNPYKENLKEVLLVEGKAISWGRAGGEAGRVINSESTIARSIKKHIKVFQEKIACSNSSAVFRETYGLSGQNYRIKGLIFYYVRDEFYSDETYKSIINQVPVTSDMIDTTVVLFSNKLLGELASIFNFLQIHSSNFQKEIEFRAIPLVRASAHTPWLSFISVEMIYSNYMVVRIKEDDELYKHFIFYKGTYSQEGLKRFLANLGRTNVFTLPNLHICPLSVTDAISQSVPFRQYFVNNELHCDGLHVDPIKVENVSSVMPTFGLGVE